MTRSRAGCRGKTTSGTGTVLGFANLNDSISPVEREILLRAKEKHGLTSDFIQNAIDNGKWKWDHAWVMDDAVALQDPIPYTHKPGTVIWAKFPHEETQRLSAAYRELKNI